MLKKYLFGLIKIKKENHNFEIKLLGIKVYSYNLDNYFGNFSIKILGICLIKSKVENLYNLREKFYLLGIPIFSKNNKYKISNLYKEFVVQKFGHYDTYICFSSGIGENFLLFLHFNEFIKKYSSKKILLLVDKKSIYDCYKLFNYKYPIKILEDPRNMFLDKSSVYKEKTFIVPLNYEYYRKVESSILNNNTHYYENLKKELEIISAPRVPVSHKENKMINNIAKNVLESTFVIIMPEAFSIQKCSLYFWQTLITKLKQHNIKIFHSVEFGIPFKDNELAINFNISELIQLAKYAKCIIGVRSGFLEVVSTISGVPTIAIYNAFAPHLNNKLTSQQILKGFSLKKLPMNQPIKEYDYLSYNDDKLINIIMKEIIENNFTQETNFKSKNNCEG